MTLFIVTFGDRLQKGDGSHPMICWAYNLCMGREPCGSKLCCVFEIKQLGMNWWNINNWVTTDFQMGGALHK